MSERTSINDPWFRNPWVWLVIAIPALTVVGCLFTMYLALSHPHILVNDSDTTAGSVQTSGE